MSVVRKIERTPTDARDKPEADVIVTSCGVLRGAAARDALLAQFGAAGELA